MDVNLEKYSYYRSINTEYEKIGSKTYCKFCGKEVHYFEGNDDRDEKCICDCEKFKSYELNKRQLTKEFLAIKQKNTRF